LKVISRLADIKLVFFENLKTLQHPTRALLDHIEPFTSLAIIANNHSFAKIRGQANASVIVRQHFNWPQANQCYVSHESDVLGLFALFNAHENIHVVFFFDGKNYDVSVAFNRRVSSQPVNECLFL
jgi:hypothetical protein